MMFCVGDRVELVRQFVDDDPPVGTTGTIERLYESSVGETAAMKWDGKYGDTARYFYRAPVCNLRPVNEPEINASDASLDVLFGGVDA